MKLNVHIAPHWVLGEMREYSPKDTVDFCIIGTGAGGGVLAQRLASFGFSVVCLEAGPWHDSEKDMVSDEGGSKSMYWEDIRIIGGSDPIEMGSNNSGKGVGGGTVHYAGFCPRLHPSDFRVRTLDGVAVDWPITYEDLEPYYEQMEREYPISGPSPYPWGKPHDYPYDPLQVGMAGQMLIKGCTELGIRVVAGGPVAIPSGTVGKERPHCIMRGFCLLGCKVGAKSSILVSHIPRALGSGAEIRTQAMAFEIVLDDDAWAKSVRYFKSDQDGKVTENEQRARAVVVSGYAVETPRLLLNSKSGRFPEGLANSSGLVGKNLMPQSGPVICGRFPWLIRQYKAPPACACSEEFYETDPRNDFVRGYALQTVAPLPISMSHIVTHDGAFGKELLERMEDYNHYACIGVLGEVLPDERNTVSLHPHEKDRFGLPAPYVRFSLFENDKKLMESGVTKAKAVMEAAGAEKIFWVKRFAHLTGTCRMGTSPSNSVVDRWCRSWDVPNLFVCDASVLPTEGASNPSITVSAIAARTADWIRQAVPRGELRRGGRSARA